MKKNFFAFVLTSALLVNYITAVALTLSPIDLSYLSCDLTRGTEITIPNFDLTKKGIKCNTERTTVNAVFCGENDEVGYYSLTPSWGRSFVSEGSVELKPNRNYIISALINCDYSRDTCEANFGFWEFDGDGSSVLYNYIATPNVTNGWYRFEGTVTTSSRTKSGCFSLALYGFDIPDEKNKFYISDLHIIELPETDLEPEAPGEGMVFGGSSGKYNMKITDVLTEESTVTVKTTGAEFVFDKTADTISAYQLINQKRLLFSTSVNKSLKNLTLKSRSNNEAVLTTGENGITFGVQMDSLMLISNHGDEDLELEVLSEIGGRWNRLSQGNLMAKDDTGGFTVNPYIPMGTGRLARYKAGSTVDFDGVVNNASFISASPAGWTVDYTISAGELLGMSVFPAREFDWEESFNSTYINYYYGGGTERYAEDAELYGAKVAVLWDFTQRGWGMSWGNKYNPLDVAVYKNNINSAHNVGMKAAPYMSMYYWHNRDVDEYIAEVQRHRDMYGIDGIYSDGLPDKEWLAAYKGARKLRELFPDGVLIFHTTGQDGNGGPPMAACDISIPAIDAYSTMTLRGEGVKGAGEGWEYPKNITSAYNTSNAIGIMKGDAWYDNGGTNILTQRKQNLINLLYNGRARITERNQDMIDYKNILKRLEISYLLCDKENYFTEHYLPLAHGLVRNDLSFEKKKGFEFEFKNNSELSGWEIKNGSESSVEVKDGTLKISDGTLYSTGSVTKSIEKHPAKIELSFSMKLEEGAGGEVFITDSKGRKCLGLYAVDGKLRYYGHLKAYKNTAVYTPGEWFNVVIATDNTQKSFSVSINGETVMDFDYFANGVLLPTAVTLSSGNMTKGSVYFDNILLKYGY